MPLNRFDRFAKRCALLSLLPISLLSTTSLSAQETIRWAGYPMDTSGFVTTPDEFLGVIRVGRGATANWIISNGIGSFFYMQEGYVRPEGAWGYSVNLDESLYDFTWADVGWLYARNSGAWVWVHNAPVALEEGHGWAFVHYGAPLPELFAVKQEYQAEPPVAFLTPPNHTNARPATEAELARFADALRIGPEKMEGAVELGPDVTMVTGADGITFRSNAPAGNRSVRLFYSPVIVGQLDLDALQGLTGEIGVTVRGTVDLTADRGGFYCQLMNDGLAYLVEETPGVSAGAREYLSSLKEVGAGTRLEKGFLYEDILMETYTVQPTRAAFIEFTLPAQASVTVKEIFLHMVTDIRGFAGLEERITGGAGATAENTHTVTNAAEMFAALEAVRAAEGEPSIIYVDGALTLADWEAAGGDGNRQFSVGGSMRNVSILGVGSNGLLDGLGFKVHGSNVVFRNLTVRDLWMRNAFEINDARYVKVTHCTMYGDEDPDTRFDEMMSVKNHARYVVIAWNHFHTDASGRSLLIGSNGEVESLPDRTIILHHNWFENVGSRHPLVRGGYTHMYNNYLRLEAGLGRGANIRNRARVRLENNYFHNTARAIFPGEEPAVVAGAWELAGNIYDGGNSSYQPTESTVLLNFEPGYTYTLDPAEDVPAIVMAGAGAEQPVD